MIKFILMVNKQGQTRLAKYTDNSLKSEERHVLEAEIVRKCLVRADKQCNFISHRNIKVVYRRYASLFFLVGIDEGENELAVLDFIHCLVEVLDKWFGNVCELDLMFNLEIVRTTCCYIMFVKINNNFTHSFVYSPIQAHFIVDEMLSNGFIVETNKANVLAPIQLLEKAT